MNNYIKKVMFWNRPYFKGKNCSNCGKPLTEPFKIMEVQQGNFRGDDEVYAFHKDCDFVSPELLIEGDK
jgi:hypothetical protein